MESTFHYEEPVRNSLQASWRHCREMFRATSLAEGFASFKQAVDTLPLWALIGFAVVAALLVFDRSLLLVPMATGIGLLAAYYTIRRAVRDALRDHGRESA